MRCPRQLAKEFSRAGDIKGFRTSSHARSSFPVVGFVRQHDDRAHSIWFGTECLYAANVFAHVITSDVLRALIFEPEALSIAVTIIGSREILELNRVLRPRLRENDVDCSAYSTRKRA